MRVESALKVILYSLIVSFDPRNIKKNGSNNHCTRTYTIISPMKADINNIYKLLQSSKTKYYIKPILRPSLYIKL